MIPALFAQVPPDGIGNWLSIASFVIVLILAALQLVDRITGRSASTRLENDPLRVEQAKEFLLRRDFETHRRNLEEEDRKLHGRISELRTRTDDQLRDTETRMGARMDELVKQLGDTKTQLASLQGTLAVLGPQLIQLQHRLDTMLEHQS
jgi:chromosome segregation ATPase